MQRFNPFSYSSLLATTSVFAINPQVDLSPAVCFSENYSSHHSIFEMFDLKTYDRIVHLLEKIKSAALEKKCTPYQLQEINNFLPAWQYNEIFLKSNDLEEEAEDLVFGMESPIQLAYSLRIDSEHQAIPAVLHNYSHYDVLYCGGIGVLSRIKEFDIFGPYHIDNARYWGKA